MPSFLKDFLENEDDIVVPVIHMEIGRTKGAVACKTKCLTAKEAVRI